MRKISWSIFIIVSFASTIHEATSCEQLPPFTDSVWRYTSQKVKISKEKSTFFNTNQAEEHRTLIQQLVFDMCYHLHIYFSTCLVKFSFPKKVIKRNPARVGASKIWQHALSSIATINFKITVQRFWFSIYYKCKIVVRQSLFAEFIWFQKIVLSSQ